MIAEKQGKFDLALDEARGLVTANLYGFWDADDVDAFQRPLRELLTRRRSQGEQVLLLFDATSQQVQSNALLDRFREGAPSDRAEMKLALVVHSSLLRLQLKRWFGEARPVVKLFTSRTEAEAWLTG